MPSALEKELLEYIAHLLRKEHQGDGTEEEPTGPSYAKLADTLGVTKPQVSDLIKHGHGAGTKVETAVANWKFKGSKDKLGAAAKRWHKEREIQLQKKPDRYPTRTRVLAQYPNRWSPPTVAAALETRFKGDDDPSAERWIMYLDDIEEMLKTAQVDLCAADEPLIGLDDVRPRPGKKRR